MRLVIDETPTLLCDNAQTVGIVNKDRPQLTTKLRHVDVHHFWLRQETQSGTMRVAWVPTNANAADGFTKNLGRAKHEKSRHNLNMRDTRDAQIIGLPLSPIERGCVWIDVYMSTKKDLCSSSTNLLLLSCRR